MTDTALRSADIVAGLPWALIGLMLLSVAWNWRSAVFIALLVATVAATQASAAAL
ncbi:hypothetical protein [Rhodopseudomonas sp. AAP120]|jgi:hypothetical protein|uniref:hypothetical protein n=1 Tax=Rhodopseudomonas sp. AAP120 TaxID=1523430 RepID=UPI000B1A3E84|nr:hypothetical protein [Rhodopseudomonas sp. AAP120]